MDHKTNSTWDQKDFLFCDTPYLSDRTTRETTLKERFSKEMIKSHLIALESLYPGTQDKIYPNGLEQKNYSKRPAKSEKTYPEYEALSNLIEFTEVVVSTKHVIDIDKENKILNALYQYINTHAKAIENDPALSRWIRAILREPYELSYSHEDMQKHVGYFSQFERDCGVRETLLERCIERNNMTVANVLYKRLGCSPLRLFPFGGNVFLQHIVSPKTSSAISVSALLKKFSANKLIKQWNEELEKENNNEWRKIAEKILSSPYYVYRLRCLMARLSYQCADLASWLKKQEKQYKDTDQARLKKGAQKIDAREQEVDDLIDYVWASYLYSPLVLNVLKMPLNNSWPAQRDGCVHLDDPNLTQQQGWVHPLLLEKMTQIEKRILLRAVAQQDLETSVQDSEGHGGAGSKDVSVLERASRSKRKI